MLFRNIACPNRLQIAIKVIRKGELPRIKPRKALNFNHITWLLPERNIASGCINMDNFKNNVHTNNAITENGL